MDYPYCRVRQRCCESTGRGFASGNRRQGCRCTQRSTVPHNYGCSQLGNDHENTRKVLRDMVKHPNAGAVLVVGLGCENNQMDAFKELVGPVDEERVKFMVCQKVDDEFETGMSLLRDLYAKASKDVRVDVPLSELACGPQMWRFRRILGVSRPTPCWVSFPTSSCRKAVLRYLPRFPKCSVPRPYS